MRSTPAALLLGLSLLALPLAGCKGNSLDGKWNVQGLSGAAPGSAATIDFSGGKATMTMAMKQQAVGELNLVVSGDYTLSGDKLDLNYKDVKIDDSKATPMAKAFLTGQDLKGKILEQTKQDHQFTIKFDSSDQVLMTSPKGTATLTRAK